MDIHTDPWLTTGDAKRKVGTFWPDASQREQDFPIARQVAIVLLQRALRNLVDLLGFAFVKRAGPDQRIDLGNGQLAHGLWSAGFSKKLERCG